jgi:C4-type Zn-finger protein
MPRAAPARACPRCSGLMKEIGRAPHPVYTNLVNVTFSCETCGHEMEAAIAPLAERKDTKDPKDR